MSQPKSPGLARVQGHGHPAPQTKSPALSDFSTDLSLLPLCGLALVIGVIGAYVAVALIRAIAFFTNCFYFQRFSTDPASPAAHTLGWLSVLVPVAGSMVVGLMARYGSDRIRGHGIPEALEAILTRGSRIDPKVAVLKPVSTAISIGSGGPFGSEGPIIMTGGAFGSLIAQFCRLTDAERKTLLVAGAAAGMSATFDAPVASLLLAVELLLFEWKPRSLIPVALASAVADVARHYLLGAGPLFPVQPHGAWLGLAGLAACLALGLVAGAASAIITKSVYFCEDIFLKLPFHWMWWPALGGLAIGLGGMIEPRALGVGYDVIQSFLNGAHPAGATLTLLLVKWGIWAVALGSGTSGGVLAPLLMMGGALGGLASGLLPDAGIGFWPMIAMGAVLGGVMRSPLTGMVFTVEITHDYTSLLPLMIAVLAAHAFSVLVMSRSILTEKVDRKGHHVAREYVVDPLELHFAEDVMRPAPLQLPATLTAGQALRRIGGDAAHARQRLYPVVDRAGKMSGIVTMGMLRSGGAKASRPLTGLMRTDALVVYTDETLRSVVHRMARQHITRVPVVAPSEPHKVVGLLSLADLLKARASYLEGEEKRRRVFGWGATGAPEKTG